MCRASLTGGFRSWFATNIIGIIPVKRGSGKDGKPLKLAEEALDRGEILVIFPATYSEFVSKLQRAIADLAAAEKLPAWE